jgi:hypothetical protein
MLTLNTTGNKVTVVSRDRPVQHALEVSMSGLGRLVLVLASFVFTPALRSK